MRRFIDHPADLLSWQYWKRAALRIDEPVLLAAMGIPVGLCSGLAAVFLNHSIQRVSLFLKPVWEHWYALLLPAVGAVLSVFLLNTVFRDGGEHGVPGVIYSVSRKGGLLRLRSSVSQLFGSLCTIAFGGSAGPEAPIVVSGASIGSNIAQLFRLNERRRVAMVGCGVAGAISAIFNAPIAGIVFAVEVIIGEWTAIHLVPIGIASVVATQVSRILRGNQIPFEHRVFNIHTLDLISCVGFAILLTGLSVLTCVVLPAIESRMRRLFANRWLRIITAGLVVGEIGFFFPDVLGEGYESVYRIIEQHQQPVLIMALLIALMKILATSLTLGTGSAGGIFAPCLVIGCFAGVAYRDILAWAWPSVEWVGSGCFGLLGMAGMIGGVLHAPLTAIFLIVEITGGYEVILSLILVSVLTSALSHLFIPASVYNQDLIERGQLLRPRTDARLLADLNVMEVINRNVISIPSDMLLRDFVDRVRDSDHRYFPVTDPNTGDFVDMISVDRIRSYLFSPELHNVVLVEEIMDGVRERVKPDDSLIDVMERFDRSRSWVLPVVENGKCLGIISKASVLNQYRTELMIQGSS
ncbi:MAG TPA: chloride channel protein [bacterium]|nr:chloride channel protein [bacterium]HQP99120.1 chloride channel protein [bacterium]